MDPIDKESFAPGVANIPKKEWPKVEVKQDERPIDRLKPRSAFHAKILSYLTDRLDRSERKMSNFYGRWEANEIRHQAYIHPSAADELAKKWNNKGFKPRVVDIHVPYLYTVVNMKVTYLLGAIAGRRPIFQMQGENDESIESAKNMELVLQHQANKAHLARVLHQIFLDGEIYNLYAAVNQWQVRKQWRSRSIQGAGLGGQRERYQKKRELVETYQGNEATNIDPFLFFPDPSVPISQVASLGEFAGWRNFVGRHLLLRDQAMYENEEVGAIRWVDHVGPLPNDPAGAGNSVRSIRAGGESSGRYLDKDSSGNVIQRDLISINLTPAELGLGPSQNVETWFFTIGNKNQIIQADPAEYDHGMLPLVVGEPYGMGYGFGHIGVCDLLAPFQDLISWLINSHMANVQAILNGNMIVDPSMIEVNDLRTQIGKPKWVRLKKSSVGQDVRRAYQQLEMKDVTSSHISDIEAILRFADMVAGTSDNLRGQIEPGGRRSATESRIASENANSALAKHARIYSMGGINDLANQMIDNTLQFLDLEYFIKTAGREGLENPIPIGPQQIEGNYNYIPHDGTLPIDKLALFDVWNQVFGQVSADPMLSMAYNKGKIFEHVAELGGAQNIEDFRLVPGSEEHIQAMVAQGQLMPTSEVPNQVQAGGSVRSVAGNPADRARGKLNAT